VYNVLNSLSPGEERIELFFEQVSDAFTTILCPSGLFTWACLYFSGLKYGSHFVELSSFS
jgi:hypothetical protein